MRREEIITTNNNQLEGKDKAWEMNQENGLCMVLNGMIRSAYIQ